MVRKKRVVLCADDYGQHPDIDAGIRTLAAAKRLSAVSALVEGAHWPLAAKQFQNEVASCALGLHFNLTHAFYTDSALSLSQVLLRSYLQKWDNRWLEQTWHKQLDAFETAVGRQPDFIDGHQHVHQLPQVREAMLTVLAERYSDLPLIRNTVARQWQGGKAAIIAILGGRALRRDLIRRELCLNSDFAGVYGFQGDHFPDRMRGWLRSVTDGALIMCHPGGDVVGDPLRETRPAELAYLASFEFLEACDAAGVELWVPGRNKLQQLVIESGSLPTPSQDRLAAINRNSCKKD